MYHSENSLPICYRTTSIDFIMESKTFPISSTQANTKSDTSTSQQASVLFKQLTQHLGSNQPQLASQQSLVNNQSQAGKQGLQQQSIVVPDKLKAELSLWLSSKPAPTIESMPTNIKNWLVPALNQLQAQQGLTSFTLSQWLPLITKMQLLNTAPNPQTAAALAQTAAALAHNTAALANSSTLLRISWLIGSSSLAGKSGAVNQENQAMIGGLLKLLIPISLQDKASLIIREQSLSSQQQAEQAKQTNEQAQLIAAQEQKQQSRVSEKNSSHSGQSGSLGNNQALSFSLTFDLDKMGTLIVDVSLNGLALTSSCYCSNKSLQNSVEKNWSLLGERLEQFGFTVKNEILELTEAIIEQNSISEDSSSRSARLIDIQA